jgi:cyanate lyase
MEALLILAALAIILMFWVVKRYLIRRKASKNRATRPSVQKTESTPAAAENRPGDSDIARPVIDRRQAGIADRRQHAVQEQTATPAPVAVREETPAALKEEATIAETPMQKQEPVAVREEAPVAVEKAKAPTPEPAPSVGREEPPADWLPEDSVLRRHYLTQLQAEREALSNPYPTDSTLRRHYDAMVKIQVDGPSLQAREAEMPTREESRRQNAASGQAAIHSLENEIASERESTSAATYDEIQAEAETANEAWLPEDSVLRRHYLTQLQAEREALSNPYPTDSMLRRHYESMIRMQLAWPSTQESREQAPVPQERAVEVPASEPSAVQTRQPEAKAEPAMRDEALVRVESNTGVPEDSILRRHFLSNLQAQIESELPDSPTDSVLKRHHDTLVCTKLAERLERMQG